MNPNVNKIVEKFPSELVIALNIKAIIKNKAVDYKKSMAGIGITRG